MLVEILAGNLLKLAKTGENTPQLRVTVIERFTENPLHQYFPHSATGSQLYSGATTISSPSMVASAASRSTSISGL